MAVPWLQIIQWVPSIVDVSRELLRKTRTPAPALVEPTDSTAAARIAALEENERRQAELVNRMAEQIAQLAMAVTALHRQMQRLVLALAGTALVAVLAMAAAWLR